MKKNPIKLIVQLFEVKSRPDGGMRIILECGKESIEGVQELIRKNAYGKSSYAIAMVEYRDKSDLPDIGD